MDFWKNPLLDKTSPSFTVENINTQLGEGAFDNFYGQNIDKLLGPEGDVPLTMRRWVNFMHAYYNGVHGVRDIYSEYETERLSRVNDITTGYIFGTIFLVLVLIIVILIITHVIDWETGVIILILSFVVIWLLAIAYRQTINGYLRDSKRCVLRKIENEYLSSISGALKGARDTFLIPIVT